MTRFCRLAVLAGLAAVTQAAFGQATFSVVTAYYTLGSSGPFNFNVNSNSAAMTIDFTPTAPSFLVGDSTSFGSGVGTIIYTVVASVPITGITMTIQGNVNLAGEVNWTETAEAGTTNLGSINGLKRGSSYSGGSDGAFTQTATLNFSQAVQSFKVKKTFDLDIGANTPPSQSVASVGLIEQDLRSVPEPCSLLALGGACVAILRRRRRTA